MSSSSHINDETERPLLANERESDYGIILANETPAVLDPQNEHVTFSRNLGTLEAFAIIISIVIGSGVFTSPGSIDTNVPSPGMALVTWLVGGLLAWTGATTLAELGTAIPGEGLTHPFTLD